jgi:hypothetical protein
MDWKTERLIHILVLSNFAVDKICISQVKVTYGYLDKQLKINTQHHFKSNFEITNQSNWLYQIYSKISYFSN